jgi:hypothetical protein
MNFLIDQPVRVAGRVRDARLHRRTIVAADGFEYRLGPPGQAHDSAT